MARLVPYRDPLAPEPANPYAWVGAGYTVDLDHLEAHAAAWEAEKVRRWPHLFGPVAISVDSKQNRG
jgi:hypothetical protein